MSTLYIFLDEGGNLDFSNAGTEYFTLTGVSMFRPFKLHTKLDTYKYDLIEKLIKPRIEMEFFHCADDNGYVRKKMFNLLSIELQENSVDSVIVKKRKTGTALQSPEKFYPKMLGYLLRYILENAPTGISELVIITDTIPVNKKRRAVEKALKLVLSAMLPSTTPYKIMHHASRSHYGLQIADYLNWAVFRKWERGDSVAYDQIKKLVRSEFDIFKTGTRNYY
ncbi:DUF3800 domain-containing protein [Yoonia sp. I 8.24]|uniref:DUF3800 domain-containing protein n=1 Tax=Yoonia sp. I 8.24 TaxID=1537229 RepID=UPI001EDCC2AB|nr:DUF3800 domain-containing protein [Yoonia sp. I 8.24]MCG3266994.1 DUF3800 domain-containing protein [Yoonia sp. I 8.24]